MIAKYNYWEEIKESTTSVKYIEKMSLIIYRFLFDAITSYP